MPDILDIFAGDAFRNVTLTERVNRTTPYVPGFLTSLGLFTSAGLLQPTAAFDEIGGSLRLISATPRGAPPSQQAHPKGKTRVTTAVHLKREAHINADELLGTRAVGSMTPQTAQGLIDARVEGPVGLKTEMAFTWEHMYLGAIDGQVYDGDNATVLYDYFNFYGIARPAAVTIPFSTSTADGNQVEMAMTGVQRAMTKALNGMPSSAMQMVAICGDAFYDKLRACKEYIAIRKIGATGNQAAADALGMTIPYMATQFANTTWVNYRGSDDLLVSVPDNEARLFPVGVPGLFQMFFAPADTFETVTVEGVPFYLLQRPEAQTSSRRVFELQSNPLPMNLRPQSTRRLVAG